MTLTINKACKQALLFLGGGGGGGGGGGDQKSRESGTRKEMRVRRPSRLFLLATQNGELAHRLLLT